MEDYSWMDQAACKGQSDLFFPGGQSLNPARKLCAGCPVQFQCEDYGRIGIHLTVPTSHGLWGGKTPEELACDEGATSEPVRYCLYCDEPVPILTRRHGGRPRKYCSRTCYQSYWEAHKHRTRPEAA